MDVQIGKYVQYKLRSLKKKRRQLKDLKARRDKLRQEIIDESPPPPDGQPKGKGATSSPVETKVIRLEKVEERIFQVDAELKKFEEIEKNISLMGREQKIIYKETILKDTTADVIADYLDIGRTKLFHIKSKLLEYIAKELGEYFDDDDLR